MRLPFNVNMDGLQFGFCGFHSPLDVRAGKGKHFVYGHIVHDNLLSPTQTRNAYGIADTLNFLHQAIYIRQLRIQQHTYQWKSLTLITLSTITTFTSIHII